MATAILQDDTTATLNAQFTRRDGELRVTFFSDDGQGFSLDELDVLEGAIAHARRQMLDQDEQPTLTVLRAENADDDIQARFRTQLRRQVPVPT